MRTKYFALRCKPSNVNIWRYKNGSMMYYSVFGGGWEPSCCSIGGNNGASWHQITRDKARKLEPNAFRS